MPEIVNRGTTPDKPDTIANIEIEQMVLGALMLDNRVIEQVGDLDPEYFVEPVHRRIYKAIRDRVREARLASPVTLRSDLADDQALMALGGPRYLANLAGVAVIAGCQHLAADLRDLWGRRELARVLSEGAQRAARPDGGSASAISSQVEADLAKIERKAEVRQRSTTFLAVTTEALSQIADAYRGATGLAGVSTGLRDLDEVTGGFEAGKVYVLGGRPSMGKTALALHFAASLARAQHAVFFASLEMPPRDIAARFYSAVMAQAGTRVPYSDMRKGNLSEGEFRLLVEKMKAHEALPLEIGDTSLRDTNELRRAAKRAAKAAEEVGGLKLLVVDYLQLLRPPGARNSFDRVTEASLVMKEIAMELNIAVLILSQLSRAVEARENKRPVLSDLRESGQIEQDADAVFFAYREAYYLERAERTETDATKRLDMHERLQRVRDEIEIIVDKQRGGRLDTVIAEIDLPTNLVRDKDRIEEMAL